MFERRVIILAACFVLAGGVLLARLAQVQIGWHDRFALETYTQAGGSQITETVRGGIYTRWGTPLARDVPCFDVGVLYDRLGEPEWKVRLSRLCDVPVEQLEARAAQVVERVERIQRSVQERSGQDPDENYVRIVEQTQYHPVLEDVPAQIAAVLSVCEATFRPEEPAERPAFRVMERSRRDYSNGTLAPHLVGQVGIMTAEAWDRLEDEGKTWTMARPVSEIGGLYKMDDRLGVSGIEAAFEDVLRGERGYVSKRRVFKVLKVERRLIESPPSRGDDVFLTINEDFQLAANRALKRASQMPELEFQSGALVILDARDGAILAAASYPGYDLSTYRDQYESLLLDPLKPLFYRPTMAALPTGSIYKIITAIAALEGGVIGENSTFDCQGRQMFRAGASKKYFHCTGYHRSIGLVAAIEKSCNIYFYNTGLRVGGEGLARWGKLFGLGEPPGQLPVPRYTYGVINLSIGQGALLCTPLQVAAAMAAVGNGGKLYKTHFFHRTCSADGALLEEYSPTFRSIPISANTLRLVREGMRRAVESGTAEGSGMSAFRAAGKTGTAELGPGQPNHAWFAGYAPHDDPKIAFAVVSERTSGHGGSHAAPIARLALEQVWDRVEAMP